MAKKKKHHGHYCKVCGEHKANEKFSGKGHAAHICKACMKLTPAQRSKEMTLRKIENMPFRYLSESEIKWLRGKMNDKDEEIQEAARNAHHAKFPNYERNMVKKGLTAFSLDFFLHGEVWNEYGDEVPVHVRFTLDRSGLARRIDYTLPEQNREREIQLESKYAKKLLKYVVHELNAPFWNDDLSDSKYIFDPYLDILPEYRYSEGYIPDCKDWEDDSEEDAAPDEEQEPGEPICTLSLELNNGENPEIKFYNQLHDEPRELYWQLQELFAPELQCLTVFQDYIITAPEEAQEHLLEILTLIEEEFPDAEQKMYHGIPAFFCNGSDVIDVGAYKDHIGLHVGYGIVDYLKKKYPSENYTKSTIQLSYTNPPPFHILEDICMQIQANLQEDI